MTTRTALVERDEALGALRRVINDAVAGRGAVANLLGPAGIGKTALLDALDLSAAEARVLRARCSLLERDYSFGVVRQLIAGLDEDAVETLLNSGGVGVTAALDDAAVPPVPDSVFAVLTALSKGLAALAEERPLVVIVDDIHWADDASLRALDFLARRVEGSAIAIILAMRQGEPVPAGSMLESVYEIPGVRTIVPAPLSAAGVTAMAHRWFPGMRIEEAFVAECTTWTSGNPLFLTEVFKQLAAKKPNALDGAEVPGARPASLEALITTRISALDEAAAAVASAVAILGSRQSLDILGEFAGLSTSEAERAIGRLIAASVLTSDLRFVHPLVESVVAEQIPAPIRATRHRDAAAILAKRSAAAQEVAAHLLHCAVVGESWAVEALETAADDALGRGAPDEAIALLQRALREPAAVERRIRLTIALARAEWLDHRPEALAHLASAAELAPAGPVRAEIELQRARLLGFAGLNSAASDALVAARDQLGDADSELGWFIDAARIMCASTTPGLSATIGPVVSNARGLPGDRPGERAALAAAAFDLAKVGTPIAELLPMVDRLTRPGRCSFSQSADGFTPVAISYIAMNLGLIRRSLAVSDALVVEATAMSSPLLMSEAVAARATARYRAGELVNAEADARAALIAANLVAGLTPPIAMYALLHSLIEQGKVAEAVAIGQTLEFPPQREDTPMAAIAQSALGRALVRSGAVENGLQVLLASGKELDAVGAVGLSIWTWQLDAALALSQLGRREEAIDLADAAVATGSRTGNPIDGGRSLRVRALVGQQTDLDMLAEAAEILRPTEAPLEFARALADWGAALRRAGYRADGRRALEEALPIADRSGALPLAEYITAELAAAGGSTRARGRHGPESLTPSERRIAALAAAGHTNREIADQLFVTVKNVEGHLAASFRKLGIRSRRQLRQFEF
ncbi:AAA family ATPase [Mycobacterium sp. CPCC 205710]|uniref:AAA family ATPase n=1 Tax=Mycobacterium deserti TaxID=2978347 RepID=A0ABT2M908_9MYCO|nr:AAA family ATPase [Mycobacterium deserti]